MSAENGNGFMHNMVPFIFKGLFLPIALPYLLYRIYTNIMRKSVSKRQSLEGKIVLITGASSGLGEALSKVLHKYGCKLILASRRRDELERVKNEIMMSNDERMRCSTYEPKILQIDLSDINKISDNAKEALKLYGKIDVLINNGGVSYRGNVMQTNVSVDQEVMRVNYFGQIALTKALLPSMVKANSGKIVVISSVQGRMAIPFRSAYAASKHALQAFYDTLRAELVNYNISVCVISPGYIKTNLSLNAVRGDGSKYGILDATTESGMDPHSGAESIVDAMVNDDYEVLLSGVSPKIAIILRVLWPNLYFYIMNNRAKRLYQKGNVQK